MVRGAMVSYRGKLDKYNGTRLRKAVRRLHLQRACTAEEAQIVVARKALAVIDSDEDATVITHLQSQITGCNSCHTIANTSHILCLESHLCNPITYL